MAADMADGPASMTTTAAPTADQIAATGLLLTQTKTGLVKYQRIGTALSSGYSQQVVSGEKCSSATWNPTRFTAQILHVWTMPAPGGPFTDTISTTEVRIAAQDALAMR